MKKHLLIAFIFCLLLAGCGAEPAPTEPTETQPQLSFTQERITFYETHDNIGAVFYVNQEMDVTERNGLTYAFSTGISQEDRLACIQITEAFLSRLDFGKPKQITVYDHESYAETYIDSGMLYTYNQTWRSAEYLTALVLSVYGEYCNYGAAYGYANVMAQEVFGNSLPLCGEDWQFSGDENVLDLNCLCFRYPYCATQDTKAAKRLANTFAHHYITTQGEDAYRTLLRQSGSTEEVANFTAALSDFYKTLGIDYTPSTILYRPGGHGYSHIAKGPCATVYMEDDWVDYNEDRIPWYYDGYLRDGYTQIKTHLTTIFREMEQYQALFNLDNYNNDLSIYYSNNHQKGNACVYDPEKHIIALPYCNSLSLLYIRSLIYDYFPEQNWAYYGLQTHFSWYYDHYGNTEDNYTRNLDIESKHLRFYQECRQRLGRDLVVEEDFWELSHFYAYYMGHTDPNTGSSDSFVAYLITRFGEDETITMLLNHDLDEDTYEALVADWNAFLQETYGETETQDVTE